MKRLLSYIAAAVAVFNLASCAKDQVLEIQPSDGIQINFKVASLNGPDTKAVKTGWVSGDKINIWFDENTQETPDMIIKYNGSSWEKDASATFSGNMPSESGYIKYFYEGFNDLSKYTYTTDTYDLGDNVYTHSYYEVEKANLLYKNEYGVETDYVFSSGILTASLESWEPATEFQIVISGIDPEKYELKSDKLEVLLRVEVGEQDIIPGTIGANSYTSGVENEDGAAFYFLLANTSFEDDDLLFTLRNKETDEEYTYKAKGKTHHLGTFTAVKIPFSKFSDRYSNQEYVDLGLPSGALWATMNLGASSPEKYGDYYAWGETETYYEDRYAQEDPQTHWNPNKEGGYRNSTYKFYDFEDNNNYIFKYNIYPVYNSHVDNNLVLDSEDDAASTKWGGDWRIPTVKEWEELKDNCDATWTEINGTYGYKFQSKIAGYTENWIFIPAAGYRSNTYLDNKNKNGYYWTANLEPTSSFSAANFIFGDSYMTPASHNRSYGFSIRPICPKEKNSGVTGVSLNMDEATLEVGESIDLIATVSGSSNSICKDYVQWTSGDESIATVDVNGKVTALRAGVTLITVFTEFGDYSTYCYLTVNPAYIDDKGKDYVDLGLSVKWATMNLGASTPTDNGKLFAWGETQTKTSFTGSNYLWYHSNTILKYCNDEEYGTVDNKMTLDADDDAVAKNWGGTWRMPTKDEIQELCDKCDWTWTDDYNGVGAKGFIVTSTIDGYTDQHIFLPAAGSQYEDAINGVGEKGYYWSSSLYSSSVWSANILTFNSSSSYPSIEHYARDNGFFIRGVIR